jgi:formylglycine-generating enzyme required for sulfatase activity
LLSASALLAQSCAAPAGVREGAAKVEDGAKVESALEVEGGAKVEEGRSSPGMALVNGGRFLMGGTDGMPDELPAHEVAVKPFLIDRREVTVGEFARFVEATGYVTDAERFGWSGVFDVEAGEWTRRDGATWRDPEAKGARAGMDEPVTQVSWADAAAYARWAGKRLPTEAEWEYAARGGLAGRRYAWGDELRPNGKPAANWWQGRFPERDTGEDGFRGRAPVGSYAPNGYGLHDMGGNVWEWCADWYGAGYYAESPARDPAGPEGGEERVMRGGSWLCSENYCTSYRAAARSHATPDTGLNNLGFRCARDL